MGILVAALALFLGFGAAYVGSEDVRYLTRAGIEQTRLLERRRPLEALVADSSVPRVERAYLSLVLAVRNAAPGLGLRPGDTYTTYTDVGRDTLLLSLTASRRDCLCPTVWKYPIVGRVPYKGFFDPKMAQAEAGKLAAKGLDVWLRPAAAYSTLGWFNDPLLSTAMIRDSVELAALVFHEIGHKTLYVKSATPFNESFAQLVGYRATEAFYRGRGDTLLANRARDRWKDEIVLADYYHTLIDSLERFYATKPTGAALEEGRAAIARWSRELLQGPIAGRLLTYQVARLAERPLNNAQLVGVLLYRTHLDWFDRWFVQHDGNVKSSVEELANLMKGATGDSAFARLGRAVGAS
jgi:predicted aminopeptidase